MSEKRLIDANVLKETIIEPLNVNDAGKNEWYEGYYTAKNEDVTIIDNAPTVSSSSGLTEAEKIICKMYLEDLDKFHTCNEYNILMGLIDNAPYKKEE